MPKYIIKSIEDLPRSPHYMRSLSYSRMPYEYTEKLGKGWKNQDSKDRK